MTAGSAGLRVLVVDDERPAGAELAYLLDRDDRIGAVTVCDSAAAALRLLREGGVDTVFLDIAMPGLDGLELAAVLRQFREPPGVVFVTAHMEHAVDAFDLAAVDYLLKPVREQRLREAVRRACDTGAPDTEDTVPVERGGVTRFVRRSDVRYVEAHGDYARLHTHDGTHLVRLPLTSLEQRWGEYGFLRIHRSLLVARAHIKLLRTDEGRCTVLVDDVELPVSRRHTAAVREALRRQRPDSA